MVKILDKKARTISSIIDECEGISDLAKDRLASAYGNLRDLVKNSSSDDYVNDLLMLYAITPCLIDKVGDQRETYANLIALFSQVSKDDADVRIVEIIAEAVAYKPAELQLIVDELEQRTGNKELHQLGDAEKDIVYQFIQEYSKQAAIICLFPAFEIPEKEPFLTYGLEASNVPPGFRMFGGRVVRTDKLFEELGTN